MDVDNEFYVFNENGTSIKFTPYKFTNLYAYNIEERFELVSVLAYTTVEVEESKYSNINGICAKAVRELQEVLTSISNYDLASTIENNVVGPSPFNRRDIMITTAIHGRDVAALKGTTTKKPSKISNTDGIRDILSHIVKNCSNVNLYIYVMHISGIMFLVGASKHIDLIQCICIRKKNREEFLEAILIMI